MVERLSHLYKTTDLHIQETKLEVQVNLCTESPLGRLLLCRAGQLQRQVCFSASRRQAPQ